MTKSDTIDIESEDDATHALLCAVIAARRKAETTGWQNRHLEQFEAYEEQLQNVYFAEREGNEE